MKKTDIRFNITGIQNAFAKTEKDNRDSSGFNGYYPFWDMNDDEEAIIRFLPDLNPNNPYGFLVEKRTHKLNINGEDRKVTCLKTYGEKEDCPICKVSSAFYKDGDEEKGKQYWRSMQHIAQCIVVKDPLPPNKDGLTHAGQYRLVSLGYQLFEVIKAAFKTGDFDVEPFARKGGCDFIITKTKQGKYSTYAVSSRFARKTRDLTEEELEIAEQNMVDLSTVLPPRPSREKLEAMLQAALTGEEWSDSEHEDEQRHLSTKNISKAMSKKSTDDEDDDFDVKSKKTATKPSKPVVEDDEFDEDADEILATIRQRRKQRAE